MPQPESSTPVRHAEDHSGGDEHAQDRSAGEHEDEGYHGPATLTVDGVDLEVTVRLLGHFQPIDGWYHWYGRVDAHDGLHATLNGTKRPVHVVTPQGAADGEVADVDPWGRYRLTGTSTPPFAVDA